MLARARTAPTRGEGIALLAAHLSSVPSDVDAQLLYALMLSWRVRLVHALQRFGSRAVAPPLDRGQTQMVERAAVADILGAIGAAAALDRLLEWSVDDRAEVRAAVWQALGTIGHTGRGTMTRKGLATT